MKLIRIALGLVLSSTVYTQELGLVPSSVEATAGESVVVSYGSQEVTSRLEKLNRPAAKWTLVGPGSLQGPNPAASITYVAPAVITPTHVMSGCQVLPPDAIFNVPVDSLPADPQSTAKLSFTYANTTQGLSFQPSWGVSVADAGTVTRSLRSFYDSIVHPGFPMPSVSNINRESGSNVGIISYTGNPNGPPDHHTLIVRHPDCTFFETYDDYLDGYTQPCRDLTPGCNVQSAVTYDSGTYRIQGGTDAAGLLLAPLTWTADEIESGEIKHATRFTNNSIFAYNSFIWPAYASAGGWSTCTANTCLQLGARLRLKSNFGIGAVCSTSSAAVNLRCETLMKALQKYGMILADTGTNNAIQLSNDVSLSPAIMGALQQIAAANIAVNPSNWDVVDETSLEVSPTSYETCPYSHSCMAAKNTFVNVAEQSILTATAPNGTSTSLPIALKGIGIGVGVPAVFPVATGSYTIQIPTWVTATTDQSVQWKGASGPGSITSSGIYSPPDDLSQGTSAVLVATSEADANATATVEVTLLSSSSSPAGALRIDTGSVSSTTDAGGTYWNADPGIEGADNTVPSDYPTWPGTNPSKIVYESSAYSEHDLKFRVGIANGNYLVHLLFGTPYNGCSSPCSKWTDNNRYNIFSFNPQLIETQGEIQNHYFDYGVTSNYSYAVPMDAYVPARVTSNILEIGVFPLAADAGQNTAPIFGKKVNSLSGIEIEPDTSSPRWVIDTQQHSALGPSASLQLYIVDYYTGTSAANWSMVSGAGSITPSGVLTISPGATTGGSIEVRATSISNPHLYATATLCVTSCSQTGGSQAAKLNPVVRGVRALERFVVFVGKEIKRGVVFLIS